MTLNKSIYNTITDRGSGTCVLAININNFQLKTVISQTMSIKCLVLFLARGLFSMNISY